MENKEKQKIESEIFNIIFEIENYAMKATKDDLKDGIDYDWLSEERNKSLEKIMNLIKD